MAHFKYKKGEGYWLGKKRPNLFSDAQKKRMSERMSGEGNPMFGKRNEHAGFQKGHTDLVPKEARKRQAEKIKGEKHYLWMGKKAGYGSKHTWMRRNFGNPPSCEDCGAIGEKKNGKWTIQWSNRSGFYLRERSDWNGRCAKCHKAFDLKRALFKC